MEAFTLKIAEGLLELSLLGLIVVIFSFVYAFLKLKREIPANAKRLYERPMQGFKNLVATGSGIVQQESVRVRGIGSHATSTINCVRETAQEVTAAVQSVNGEDLRILLENAQRAAKVASFVADFARSSSKQGGASS